MMHFRAGDKGKHYPSMDILYRREGYWYQSELLPYLRRYPTPIEESYLLMETRLLPLTYGRSPIDIKIHP